ncbi:MAG: hypothetical protein FJY85_10985, partial [Deltaproteobacteria bacterium]|nr:hypothetical protein [Deltaproteobacteria bacterium]
REKAERHKLTLDLRVDSSLQRAAVLADEVRLKEIMVNLLSNAVKFTPDGGSVLVEANLKGDELVVGVSDSGIGVKPEDQERIFHPFEQVDSQLSRRHLGTGLGLALSRKLAELHGGRIWVESEGEGQGSAFRVAIPFVQAPVPTSAMVAAWLEEDVAFRVKDAGRETAGGQVATVLVADEKQTYVNPGTGMRGEEG